MKARSSSSGRPANVNPFACLEQGCTFVGKSVQSLAMHVRRKHSPDGKKWGAPGSRKKRGSIGQPLHAVHFCPNCGVNLLAVQAALSIR